MATLRELRQERGMTQFELAYRAGISIPALRRMEQGKPVLATSVRLVAGVLGIGAMDLEMEGVVIADRIIRGETEKRRDD